MAMPPEHREVILLRDYHGLSYAEMARVLETPPGTIMSRLHRARTELRNRMRRYWE
jgi:RNA polymerase sigma-70 factor (ECF subfamily)